MASKYLSLNNLSKSFGAGTLFSGLTCDINQGDRIGLIGPNGSGKTTLIRILLGRETAGEGRVFLAPGVRLGYVPQWEDFGEGETPLSFLLEPSRPLAEKLKRAEEGLASVTEDSYEKALGEYTRIREEWDDLEGDSLEERARNLLEASGLGIQAEVPAGLLSGGEQNALLFLRALMDRPDLLILDEPGNHLDFLGLEWLEEMLCAFRGSLLLVSHNRYMLDRVCTSLWEIEGGRLHLFAGGYSEARMTKLQNLAARQGQYAARKSQIDRLEALVVRFEQYARNTADPAWGKRLKSRRTQLEKLKEETGTAPTLENRRISLDFGSSASRARTALRLEGYSKAFGDRLLFREARGEILCGERLALVGPNGSGKSTLIREIIAEGSWDHPVLKVGPSQTVGYLAQGEEGSFGGLTVEDEVRSWGPLSRDEGYGLIRPFLFRWEDWDKPIAALSGGERNRLQLARLIYGRPNFLILDEPTNHMDIPSREAIEEALERYPGTVLLVSHDRYLLDRLAEKLWVVEDARLSVREGGFSLFWRTFSSRGRGSEGGSGTILDRAKRRGREREARGGAPQKHRGDLLRLEGRIEELERLCRRIEGEMEGAFRRGDHRRGRTLGMKLEKNRRILEDAYRS